MPFAGNATLESLDEFVDPLMIPSYFEFSEDEVENVFDKKKNIVFMFRDEKDKDSEFMKVFEEAS